MLVCFHSDSETTQILLSQKANGTAEILLSKNQSQQVRNDPVPLGVWYRRLKYIFSRQEFDYQ